MQDAAHDVLNGGNKENTSRNLAALRARVRMLRESGSTPAKDSEKDKSTRKDGSDVTSSIQPGALEKHGSWAKVLDSVERHSYANLDRAAYRKVEKIIANLRNDSDNPERWLLMLNCLKSTSFKSQIPVSNVLQLYESATRKLNLRENRQKKTYVQLWLSYATEQATISPEDARDTFKYMRAHRIGEDTAELYETWALFEARNGNSDKAKKLFEEAASRRADSAPPPTREESVISNPPRKPPAAAGGKSSASAGKDLTGNTTEDHSGDDTILKKRGRTPMPIRKPLLSTGPARRVRNDDTVDGHLGMDELVTTGSEGRQEAELKATETWGAQPVMEITAVSKTEINQGERSAVPLATETVEATPSISTAVKRLRLTSVEKNLKSESWSSLWTTYDNDNETKSSATESPELSRHTLADPADSIPEVGVNDLFQESKSQGGQEICGSSPEREERGSNGYGNGQKQTDSSADNAPIAAAVLQDEKRRDENGNRDDLETPTATPSVLNSMTDSVVQVNDKQFLRLEMVGRGGSSKVYKVMGPDRKIYALKKVRIGKKDQSTISSYANEIKLLMRLRGKPHIVQLFDAEVREEAGLIYVVMEFGDIDLARLLSRGRGKPVNSNFLRLYWQQMLEAVHTIHEERIVHGDLKPANFLLVEGALKLIDFGIAKAIQNDDTTNIVRDSQVGTPNYMSPEALLCAPDGSSTEVPTGPSGRKKYKLGRASDIWSLGCILYQMVSGRTPFAHLSMIQKLHSITDPSYEIQFPPIRNAYLLEDLRKCLQRDPMRRPSIPELLRSRFLFPDQRMATAEDEMASRARGVNAQGEVSRDMLSSILEQLRSMNVNIPAKVLNDPALIDELLSRL
ncbi:hypothetical protein NDN08_004585 [Rhodosorus marinus]|uniref:Protein kinase domain-containing protein n=1 Tax=Rhodosorus marinus TaxID=101924 RepID=A0AAV8UPF8_9RHOD|nr:hypothetical protein NDN08_004585 [Rhodosorus marinus]